MLPDSALAGISSRSPGAQDRFFRQLWHLHFDEPLRREKVILSRIVDHAQEAVIAVDLIGRKSFVYLGKVQVHALILARIHADHKSGPAPVPSSRRRFFILRSRFPIPCASYQCSSTCHMLPSGYRTAAVPFIFLQWSRPNRRHNERLDLTPVPLAIVSMLLISLSTLIRTPRDHNRATAVLR